MLAGMAAQDEVAMDVVVPVEAAWAECEAEVEAELEAVSVASERVDATMS